MFELTRAGDERDEEQTGAQTGVNEEVNPDLHGQAREVEESSAEGGTSATPGGG